MLKRIIIPCLLLVFCGLFMPGTSSAVPPAVKAKSEFMLADELFNKNDYKGAIEHAEKAKSILGKSNSRIEYMLTKAYYESKDYDKSFTAIEAFFELTPESESGSKQYGEMVALYAKIEAEQKKLTAAKQRLAEVAQNPWRDPKTDLTWQRTENGERKTWQEAVDHCQNLTLAGKSDWRLPTIEEFKTIVIDDQKSARNKDIFPYFDEENSWYWSSTTTNTNSARSVRVNTGNVGSSHGKYFDFNVRCVR